MGTVEEAIGEEVAMGTEAGVEVGGMTEEGEGVAATEAALEVCMMVTRQQEQCCC